MSARFVCRGSLTAAVLLVAAAAPSAHAQNDASKIAQGVAQRPPSSRLAPAVPSTPIAPDTNTTDFVVSGVHIIQRRELANDVVAVHLYLLGGTSEVPADKSGLEPLLLATSERGTRHYSKQALREALARVGSGIDVNPDVDWTVFGFNSIAWAFDSTWNVFADRLMAPTLDSTEFEQVREQYLSAVRQRSDNPDSYVEYLADSVAFAGHPYGIDPSGTEQSIASITLADLRAFERQQMVTSRMLLVVVGKVDRAHLERLVRATIGKLPAGSYQWTPPPTLGDLQPAVTVTRRDLPTNYILGYFAGPPASSKDYDALRVATAVLAGDLFNEVRSRRNLTYAVNAPFLDRAQSAGGLYVSTVSPETTLVVMKNELAYLQTETIDREPLEHIVQQFITHYYLENEANADQADLLARAQLYQGDYRAATRFVDGLRAVSPEDVRRVTRTYMRHMRFAYVGDPSLVPRSLLLSF